MPRKAVAPVVEDDLTTTLELLSLADLRPHPRNDGQHPAAEIAHLKQSLTEHGVYRNVVVAQDGTILAGHGVVQAARELGHTTIAGKRLAYGPEDPRALKILVGDNHIARLREQDNATLVALLEELGRDDPLALLGTGFDEASLAALAEAQEVTWQTLAPESVSDESHSEGGSAAPQLSGLLYQVLVVCDDEAQQTALLQRFADEGLVCRALIS